VSLALPATKFGTAKALWKRAPWWRFSILCAALLMVLMALFPPRMEHRARPSSALDAATYQPPSQDESIAAAPSSASTAPVRTTAPTPEAAPARAKPKPARPPAAVSNAPAAAPKNAALALATPSNQPASNGAAGINAALMGRTYQHELLMDGFKVPLPPGDWVVLASSSVKVIKHPENTGMNYFLGQIEHTQLVGAMIVIALRSAQPESGFEEWQRCSNPQNIYTSKEDMAPFGHQACWIMHTMFTPPLQQWADNAIKIGNLERAAAGDMAAKGISYPQDLVAVHFFRAETWGLLEATYLFSPEHEHITSNVVPTLRDSDWFGANLQKYPEKVAYIDKLRQWGDAHWPAFKAAFDAGR
jgi:hypothetical protein